MPKNGQCRPAGQGTRLRPSCLSFRRRSPATIDSSSSHIPLPGMAQVRGRNLGARGEKPRWPPLFQRQKEWLAHCRLQPAPDCVEQRYGNVMRNCVAFAGSQCSLEAMCKVLGATPPVLCAPVLILRRPLRSTFAKSDCAPWSLFSCLLYSPKAKAEESQGEADAIPNTWMPVSSHDQS